MNEKIPNSNVIAATRLRSGDVRLLFGTQKAQENAVAQQASWQKTLEFQVLARTFAVEVPGVPHLSVHSTTHTGPFTTKITGAIE